MKLTEANPGDIVIAIRTNNRRQEETIRHAIHQFNLSHYPNRTNLLGWDAIDFWEAKEYFEEFDTLKEMNT